jgi:hypothetical protein
MSDFSALNNMLRAGHVSSFNETERTARIIFRDKVDGEGNPHISADLTVVQSISKLETDDFVLCAFPANCGGNGYVIEVIKWHS